VIGFALLSAALLQAAPAAEPEIGIDVARVTYGCVLGEIASATAGLEITLTNQGAAPISVPARGVDIGSQRYARTAEDLAAGRFAASLSGVLILTAGTPSPPKPDDFRQLRPGQSHVLVRDHAISVSATGAPIAGTLNPGDYVAQFHVGSGVPWSTDRAAWTRVQRILAPLWQTNLWSKPFRLVVPPIPAHLPECRP
jgi:hypothetical protein